MTVKQAAARLEVSVSTVYGLVASGKLGHLSVSVREGTTFTVQWGPPRWLRRESFAEVGDEK